MICFVQQWKLKSDKILMSNIPKHDDFLLASWLLLLGFINFSWLAAIMFCLYYHLPK